MHMHMHMFDKLVSICLQLCVCVSFYPYNDPLLFQVIFNCRVFIEVFLMTVNPIHNLDVKK